MYGSDAEMQLRDGSFHLDGDSSSSSDDSEQAESYHHGFCTDGEHYAVWYVPIHE
jgi:hypothetical protein